MCDGDRAAVVIEFDGVVNQVGEHLFEAAAIGVDGGGGLDFVAQGDAPLCCAGGERGRHIFNERTQSDVVRLDRDCSGFDGGQFQNVVNQVMHARGVFANDGEEAQVVFAVINRAVFECLDESDDGGERRAQLV
jgi:hypothetical protein